MQGSLEEILPFAMMVVGPVAGPTEWKFVSSLTTPLAGRADGDGGTADLDEIGLL